MVALLHVLAVHALALTSPPCGRQPALAHHAGAPALRAAGPGGARDPAEERVAVSRKDFDEKLRGRAFKRWSDFKEALGEEARLEPRVGGEVRLMSGLSIAFAIILNVLVWAVVAYVVMRLVDRDPRCTALAVLGILCLYGGAVNAYCHYAYAQPELRLITNFLFGLVPLTASAASYIVALLVLDLLRSTTSDGFNTNLWERLRPWEEKFDGRLIFFLAVLPGLVMSIHLGNTVSTGFTAAATHFDVLSLCLFIDVGRFAGHLSYLVAREWSIGKSPTSMSSRPGLAYVFYTVCLAWYFALVCLEAGRTSVVIADRTKIHTLASLTSYVFFPLALYLGFMNLREFFEQFLVQRQWLEVLAWVCWAFCVAVSMLMVAVVFDIIEPNLMGIAALLWIVFYSAWKMSGGSLLGFILAMVPLAAAAYGAALVSTTCARLIRDGLFELLAP